MSDIPIQIVDEHDRPIGQASIAEAQTRGLVHRISRVMVEDGEGRLLLQKRADHKRLYPGRWDNSAAGHVDAGETYEEAAAREALEEIGLLDTPLEEIGAYKHEGSFNNLILKRFNKVYKAIVPSNYDFSPSSDEVSEVKWFSQEELHVMLNHHPELVTDGVRDVIERYYVHENHRN